MALAGVDHATGRYPPEAARFVAESARIQRALANPAGLAFAMLHQANLAVWDGDDALAASRFDEAERLIAELGDDRLRGRAALSRAMLNLRTGGFAAARRPLEARPQPARSRQARP